MLQPRLAPAHIGADSLPLGDRCRHQELQSSPSAKAALGERVLGTVAMAVGVQIQQIADNRQASRRLASLVVGIARCNAEYTSAR